jgi:hypothetical protein
MQVSLHRLIHGYVPTTAPNNTAAHTMRCSVNVKPSKFLAAKAARRKVQQLTNLRVFAF